MTQETMSLLEPRLSGFGSLQAISSGEDATRDYIRIANSTELEEDIRPDATGTAVQVCEKRILRPYRGTLIMLGWLSFYKEEKTRRAMVQQGCVIMTFLCIIFVTFILQALVCFQRDILFLTKEVCNVSNKEDDINRVCCKQHTVTAFGVPDLLILSSYLFGLYLFSSAETEHLSKLAGEVFIKMTFTTGEQFPSKLIKTIGAYCLAGIAWIISSFVLRVLYLVAFKYWDSEIAIYWSDAFLIHGQEKRTFIVLSIIGFIFLDIVYAASIINYAIQSELNVHLLNAISKSVANKLYSNLDEGYKDISNAECNLRVLNGKTATGASLVIFKLSISAVLAFQQLEQLTENKTFPFTNRNLSYIVATLNAGLWTTMVVFAFIQASRVTGAGLGLKRSGVIIRSRPFQYSTSPPSDLDSFVLYTQAVKLRAKLFGVPVVPWVMYIALAVLCFVLIVMIKADLYNPYPFV